MAQGRAISWVSAGTAFGDDMTMMECPSCGIDYAVPEKWRAVRRQDGKGWNCPNGCNLHYPREESVSDRRQRERLVALERDLAAEKNRNKSLTEARQWAESRAKGANIVAGRAKAAHRRLQQRVMAGVCPCCHRTFKQLAAHMKSKHPEAAK